MGAVDRIENVSISQESDLSCFRVQSPALKLDSFPRVFYAILSGWLLDTTLVSPKFIFKLETISRSWSSPPNQICSSLPSGTQRGRRQFPISYTLLHAGHLDNFSSTCLPHNFLPSPLMDSILANGNPSREYYHSHNAYNRYNHRRCVLWVSS